MIAPITIAPITARGMSLDGFRLSPASWSACSKPSSAKMMPEVETAARMPAAPFGLKPSAAVKFDVWKPAVSSAMIVITGIATFHHVAALLVLASFLTERKLIAVKNAIRTTAATIPLAVSTCWPLLSFIQCWANE